MSAKGSFWAWEITGLKASQKLVLLCLGDCHNGENGRCDPSVNFIHDKTGLNKKTIPGALAELEKLGFIRINKRPGTSTSYDLLFNENPISTSPENGDTQKRDNPKTGIPESGARDTPKTGDDLPQKRVTNLKRTCKEPKTDLDLSVWPEQPSQEVWVSFVKLRKTKRATLDQTIIKNYAKPLHELHRMGFSVDTVLAECCTANWQGLETHWFLRRKGIESKAQSAPSAPNRPKSLIDTYAEQESSRG